MNTLTNPNSFQRCSRILKVFSLLIALWLISGSGVHAAEDNPVGTLPPIVAQAAGPASTIIFWHDVDEDGIPDYMATYIFKDGRLRLLEKIPPRWNIPAETKRSQISALSFFCAIARLIYL